MHIRCEPSFFLTKRINAPHDELLRRRNCLPNSSCSYDDSSCTSGGANRYGALAIRVAPGTRSILNSTYLSGGTPGNSSGKTSTNSLATGTFETETGSLTHVSTTYTK
ncbi:unnamed protein product [Lactuca virosa]|uniref:Uncharacterized protein n=1 Tax=Lactuca virosa TaxID=75947 RepID=A0AAU9M2D4_9ASTR|nr:unnamed protein product [Lactuca virosa]